MPTNITSFDGSMDFWGTLYNPVRLKYPSYHSQNSYKIITLAFNLGWISHYRSWYHSYLHRLGVCISDPKFYWDTRFTILWFLTCEKGIWILYSNRCPSWFELSTHWSVNNRILIILTFFMRQFNIAPRVHCCQSLVRTVFCSFFGGH